MASRIFSPASTWCKQVLHGRTPPGALLLCKLTTEMWGDWHLLNDVENPHLFFPMNSNLRKTRRNGGFTKEGAEMQRREAACSRTPAGTPAAPARTGAGGGGCARLRGPAERRPRQWAARPSVGWGGMEVRHSRARGDPRKSRARVLHITGAQPSPPP